jgi:hypothetical protein
MVDFANADIEQLAIHFAGNKFKEEGYKLTDRDVLNDIGDDEQPLLLKFFLRPFTTEEFYSFSHSSDVGLNEIYNFAGQVFANPSLFKSLSIDICKHLYECSMHPKIKAGELYVALFSNCNINGQQVNALGIFKSESKDKFINIEFNKTSLSKINFLEGIDPKHLDKGCIIFDNNAADGYDVMIVDNTNRGGEAQFWKDDFLNVIPKQDEYFNTTNYIKLCKDFVMNELPSKFEVGKSDQIDILNRSVDFFKNNESFENAAFTEEIFGQPEVINSFNEYKDNFQRENNFSFEESFDISNQAVKRQSRTIKSILKLDKNFHVYIHGDRNLIEKGFDDVTGKHYYKIYFDEES